MTMRFAIVYLIEGDSEEVDDKWRYNMSAALPITPATPPRQSG